jgi:NADH-quinone oxidoreductase subunit M
MPDKDPRSRQAFGHVLVTSNDESAGEVAIGFRAQLPTGLGVVGEHLLTLLVVSPLSVVLLAAVFWLAGRRDDAPVRALSGAVALFDLGLALWAVRGFATDLGRADGNDGFQLVERAVWLRSIGVEWYLGVDGINLLLVVVASVVAVVAVGLAIVEERSSACHAGLGLLSSGTAGVFVALDLVVLVSAWVVAWAGLLVLSAGSGSGRRRGAASKLATVVVISSVALLLALVALAGASGRGFLVDGTPTAHTLALPEIGRTSFAGREPILGMPFVDVVWSLLLLTAVGTGPLVPLHGWLADVAEDAPAPVSLAAVGAMLALGPYVLVRVGFGALPEGAPAVSSTLATLGVVSAAWGSLCAMVQRDLRRFYAYACLAASGIAFFGLAGLTAEGLAGAMMMLSARAVGAALFLGFVSALDRRLRTGDVYRLAGLAAQAPALAAFGAIGLGVSLGLPALAGSWGELLAFVGSFQRFPALAFVLAAALVASAVAHLRVARFVFLERSDGGRNTSALLAPFDGALPDATTVELAALVPVVVFAFLLGLWPAPVLSLVTESVRAVAADLSALDVARPVGP